MIGHSLSTLASLLFPLQVLVASLLVRAELFDPLQHSGPASPYFDAPSQFGISVETPRGCTVDQAAYILRHGSRYPEPGSFAGWQALFAKFQNASYIARGPLAFIPSWAPPVDDVPHQPLFLTSTGAQEAFDLGVQLRKKYRFTKGGDNFTVWAASQQRVVDTATYFVRGYLSQGNYLAAPSLNRGSIVALPDSVNSTFADSLTPSSSCPAYDSGNTGSQAASAFRASYQDRIAKRLNTFLEGLQLNAGDVGPTMDLCGFSSEIDGDTRFCDIFEPSEWLGYEYAHDLNYYYGSGPGNPIAAATGYPWIKAITDLFLAGPGNATSTDQFIPPPLIMGFTHDNNLPPVIAALGLWNTSSPAAAHVYPLSLTRPDPRRTFRASYSVAFRSYVVLERLTCVVSPPNANAKEEVVRHERGIFGPIPDRGGGERDSESYVRVRINNAPVPIPGCATGPGSTCALHDFAAYVARRGAIVGDFVERCGLRGVRNATSEVSFLTRLPDPATVQIVGL